MRLRAARTHRHVLPLVLAPALVLGCSCDHRAPPSSTSGSVIASPRRRHQVAWLDRGIRASDPATQEELLLDSTPRLHGDLDVSADRRRVVMADSKSGEVLWFDLTRRDHEQVLCRGREP